MQKSICIQKERHLLAFAVAPKGATQTLWNKELMAAAN